MHCVGRLVRWPHSNAPCVGHPRNIQLGTLASVVLLIGPANTTSLPFQTAATHAIRWGTTPTAPPPSSGRTLTIRRSLGGFGVESSISLPTRAASAVSMMSCKPQIVCNISQLFAWDFLRFLFGLYYRTSWTIAKLQQNYSKTAVAGLNPAFVIDMIGRRKFRQLAFKSKRR